MSQTKETYVMPALPDPARVFRVNFDARTLNQAVRVAFCIESARLRADPRHAVIKEEVRRRLCERFPQDDMTILLRYECAKEYSTIAVDVFDFTEYGLPIGGHVDVAVDEPRPVLLPRFRPEFRVGCPHNAESPATAQDLPESMAPWFREVMRAQREGREWEKVNLSRRLHKPGTRKQPRWTDAVALFPVLSRVRAGESV